jgi:hypothetical protein
MLVGRAAGTAPAPWPHHCWPPPCPLPLPALLQRGALNAVAEQHQMVRLHRLRLLANFIVKGADQKSASTSSIAKLPVHKVGAWGH